MVIMARDGNASARTSQYTTTMNFASLKFCASLVGYVPTTSLLLFCVSF